MKRYVSYLPYVILIVALISSLLSLYFSEILNLTPCLLCWYQRIAMYPLVAISAVGILLQDKKFYLYILPIAAAGWVIALYQNLLYYNVIPEQIAPCREGVSCTAKLIQVFGFIDIPLGSFIAFTIILICSIMLLKLNRK